jgi:hypothetical protein
LFVIVRAYVGVCFIAPPVIIDIGVHIAAIVYVILVDIWIVVVPVFVVSVH